MELVIGIAGPFLSEVGFTIRLTTGDTVDYDEVEALLRRSSAWLLLRAGNAALVISFLGRVFVAENVREIASGTLADRLDDELYSLNQRLGLGSYPKAAKTYLDDWASAEAGWLRKYYPVERMLGLPG
jgi:hypothetical protein